jgi:hypothetical protein
MPIVNISEISQVVLYDLTEALFELENNETNNDINDINGCRVAVLL